MTSTTRPIVHPAADGIYARLPDYVRKNDPATGYVTLALCAGLAANLEDAVDLLTLLDPTTSLSGTCELANPQRIPTRLLPLLARKIGINIATLPIQRARDTVDILTRNDEQDLRALAHGSRPAIRAVVQLTLSDPDPAARVWANFSGDDPYLITVVTNIDQTPDPVATLEAALSQCPADMRIELQIVEATVWAEIEAAFPDAWADVETAFPDAWADVEAWIPTT